MKFKYFVILLSLQASTVLAFNLDTDPFACGVTNGPIIEDQHCVKLSNSGSGNTHALCDRGQWKYQSSSAGCIGALQGPYDRSSLRSRTVNLR